MFVVLRSCTRVHLTFTSTSFAEPFRGFQQRFKVVPVRMVEGHGCHRVAHAHRKLLVGKRFVAKSPNGRFTEGASAHSCANVSFKCMSCSQAIPSLAAVQQAYLQDSLCTCCTGAEAVHQKPLTRIEVHGKNLFYFFGDTAAPKVVHIHFGMSGAFKTMTLPGPETTETTRLTLENSDHNIIAHLSAMTVNLGDLGEDTSAYSMQTSSMRWDIVADQLCVSFVTSSCIANIRLCT